jgi:hypothetical protein
MDIVQLRRCQPYARKGERQEVSPVYHRAQRQQQQTRRTEEDEQLLDSLTGQERQPRQPGHTEKLRTGSRGNSRQQRGQQPRRQLHPGVYIGSGMFTMLGTWSLLLHIGVWYMNTLHDPGYYTQTAHRDTVTITDAQGHQYQARGVIDPQNHIDLLVMPENGDPSKARIIQGPALSIVDDPQHQATITATASGSEVTILVQGPLVANWFDLVASRQREQWSADASQQSKGGK